VGQGALIQLYYYMMVMEFLELSGCDGGRIGGCGDWSSASLTCAKSMLGVSPRAKLATLEFLAQEIDGIVQMWEREVQVGEILFDWYWEGTLILKKDTMTN